ncbi:MAG: hypothetical protein ABJC74_09610 [Gemmatimonadota bacterium]
MKPFRSVIFSLGLACLAAPAFAIEVPVQREIEKANWLAAQYNPMNPAQLGDIGAAIWLVYARAIGQNIASSPTDRPWLAAADQATGGQFEAGSIRRASLFVNEPPPSLAMVVLSLGLVGLSVTTTFKRRTASD